MILRLERTAGAAVLTICAQQRSPPCKCKLRSSRARAAAELADSRATYREVDAADAKEAVREALGVHAPQCGSDLAQDSKLRHQPALEPRRLQIAVRQRYSQVAAAANLLDDPQLPTHPLLAPHANGVGGYAVAVAQRLGPTRRLHGGGELAPIGKGCGSYGHKRSLHRPPPQVACTRTLRWTAHQPRHRARARSGCRCQLVEEALESTVNVRLLCALTHSVHRAFCSPSRSNVRHSTCCGRG